MTADGEQAADAATKPEDNPQVDTDPEGKGEVDVEGSESPAPTARPVNPRSLPKEPEWADQRTMLSEHPRWALGTMSLLVVGLVVGYFSMGAFGRSVMHRCVAVADAAACNPRTQGLVLALPVLALALGLVISFLGGRRLARRGKKAVHAAWAGWALFLLTAVICYGVVGGHA
jgi:hypothetical protein